MNVAATGFGATMSKAPQVNPARLQAPREEGAAAQPRLAGPETTMSSSESAESKPFNVNALVKNLWGFMQGRLADAKASGASNSEMESLWQAAEEGLKKGFSEAKDVLTSLGKLNDSLENDIDQAYGRLTDTLDRRDVTAKAPESAPGVEEASRLAGAERQVSLYQYRERTFALDITTAEGDRISVSVRNSHEAGAQHSRGEGWSHAQWGRSDSAAFALRIEGDLSERERADLDRLLGDVNTLANEFYDGDLDVAWRQARALDIDGTSLASMDLSLRSVDVKGAAAYQQQARPAEARLPRGLEPLRDYAQTLVDAQRQWQDRFQSGQGLLGALDNHPRNDGRLARMAHELLG